MYLCYRHYFNNMIIEEVLLLLLKTCFGGLATFIRSKHYRVWGLVLKLGLKHVEYCKNQFEHFNEIITKSGLASLEISLT